MLSNLTATLHRFFLQVRGYRPEWSDRQHPLSTHKPRAGRDPVEIRRRQHRQAILQAHVHLHRDRIHPIEPLKREGRELASELEMIRMKEREAERRLNSVVEQIALLVDRRLYQAGL